MGVLRVVARADIAFRPSVPGRTGFASRGRWRTAGEAGLILFAFVLVARLQVWLDVAGAGPVIGIGAGFAVAVLIAGGQRWWPAVLAGLLLPALAQDSSTAVIYALADAAQAVVGARLLRAAGITGRLERINDAVTLVLRAGVIAPALGATAAVVAMLALGLDAAAVVSAWQAAWLRDLVGVIVVAPAGMLVGSLRDHGWGLRRPTPADAAVVLALGLATAAAFSGVSRSYFVFPALLVLALRWHVFGAMLGGLVVSIGAAWSAAQGIGPFAAGPSAATLVQSQVFAAIATLTALLLGAAMAERVRDQQRLLDSEAERVAMECEREAEQRFRRSFEDAPIGMAILGFNGHFLRVNQALGEITGFARDELVGRTIEDRTHPDDCGAYAEILAALIAGATRTSETELRFIRRDGSVAWVLLGCSVVRDDSDRPIYAIAQVVDMSDRKRIEAELARSAAELRRSNEELEHFAYVASHDLGEPLRHERLRHPAAQSLCRCPRRAQRMQELIDGLLEYSRAGRRQPASEPVDCAEVARAVLGALDSSVRARGAVVSVGALPRVLGDALLLRQLLQNLLANALKFTGDARPQVSVQAESRGCEAIFSVRDNGIGIEPHLTERIFEMFQRLHTREHYEGTGIGLALVKRIVELHGGRIWVESQFGQGTTFFFTLPLAPDGPTAPVPALDPGNAVRAAQPLRPLAASAGA